MAKTVYSPKDRIDHTLYGPGTIVEANEQHVSIVFDGTGKKKFITSKVVLTRSDSPAPLKAASTKKPTKKKK